MAGYNACRGNAFRGNACRGNACRGTSESAAGSSDSSDYTTIGDRHLFVHTCLSISDACLRL
ncbi:MAG: hypothetical protein ACLFM4_11365 [Phormidium sp.]